MDEFEIERKRRKNEKLQEKLKNLQSNKNIKNHQQQQNQQQRQRYQHHHHRRHRHDSISCLSTDKGTRNHNRTNNSRSKNEFTGRSDSINKGGSNLSRRNINNNLNKQRQERIQKLKEEKGADEGLRLIHEHYGNKFTSPIIDSGVDSDADTGNVNTSTHTKSIHNTTTRCRTGTSSCSANKATSRNQNSHSQVSILTQSTALSGGSQKSTLSIRSTSRHRGTATNTCKNTNTGQWIGKGTHNEIKQQMDQRNENHQNNEKESMTCNKNSSRNKNSNSNGNSNSNNTSDSESKLFFPRNNNYDDESSDDDLVAIGRNLQKQEEAARADIKANVKANNNSNDNANSANADNDNANDTATTKDITALSYNKKKYNKNNQHDKNRNNQSTSKRRPRNNHQTIFEEEEEHPHPYPHHVQKKSRTTTLSHTVNHIKEDNNYDCSSSNSNSSRLVGSDSESDSDGHSDRRNNQSMSFLLPNLNNVDDDESSDDNLMDISRRIEHKEKQQRFKTKMKMKCNYGQDYHSHSDNNDSSDNDNDVNDYDSNDDEPRTLSKINKVSMTFDDDDTRRMNNKNICNNKFKRQPPIQEDDIWDDSDHDHDYSDKDDEAVRRKATDLIGKKKRYQEKQKLQRTGRRERLRRSKKSPLFEEGLLVESDGGIAGSGSDYDYDDNKMEKQLKPDLKNPKWPPTELEPLILSRPSSDEDGNPVQDVVPASINRYLKDFQREGIKFMHRIIAQSKGAILGDDMGLGKTVQVISLLAAMQKKSGTMRDLKAIKERRAYVEKEQREEQMASDEALLNGLSSAKRLITVDHRPYAPILVIVPPSVIANWSNEFNQWGHFSVEIFGRENDRLASISQVKKGIKDILLIGKSLFTQSECFQLMIEVKWELVIIDEFHEYKNNKTKAYQCLEELRDRCRCPLVGLTGTVMSNDYKELWTLVNLVQPGLFGDWKTFNTDFNRPIKLARAKDAKEDVLALGNKRNEELKSALPEVYLHRDKDKVLENFLPSKTQTVMFCELSDIQKQIYQRILKLPEYELLQKSNSPCDCTVNQNFFKEYKKLVSNKERIHYYRRFKKKLKSRKSCCYKYPFLPGTENIDPRAILWLGQHDKTQIGDDDFCKQCPSCILLPALSKLYKVCSHASMLQLDRHPDHIEGEAERKRAENELAFAKLVLSPEVLKILPGNSYIRESSILSDHGALSGKMKILDICLRQYEKKRDRVLIFSYSTTTLDFIEQFVKEKGYSHLRLDGSTPTKKRQELIDKFQRSKDTFLFLISTKAGGLGLNLTAANKVIIYDVNWNPSHDEQAQDRAFRIGQNRDVDVLRLVARGTIEELKYARQVYKVHLKQQTLEDNEHSSVQPARLFRGVDRDKNRKGELFGSENLLKFKDGSFMEDLWKASENNGQSKKEYDESELAAVMYEKERLVQDGFVNQDEEIADFIVTKTKGFNHEDFLREDRGNAALIPGDEGFDEELGGSQINHLVCESVCKNILDDSNEEEALLNDVEQSLISIPSNLQKKVQIDIYEKINDWKEVGQAQKKSSPKTPPRMIPEKNIERTEMRKHDSQKNFEVAPKKKNLRIISRTGSLLLDQNVSGDSALHSSNVMYLPTYLHKTK